MKQPETCPTCGAALGPLHRDALQNCAACERPNPRGFRYCGFCAAPLESALEHAERADVAAPAGGWPSLARELVELRFYLDRGELDEAFELLSILRERHPGHPALAEYSRGPAKGKPRADTQVHQLVDAVLADSASLSSSSLPRRAVPQWNAPMTDDEDEDGKTRAHVAVPLGVADDEEPTSRRAKPAPASRTPRAPAAGRSRAKTNKHLGAVPPATAVAAVAPPGLTVAVPTLQAAAPFGEAEPASSKRLVRKRALKPHKRTGQQAVAEPAAAEPVAAAPTAGRRRARGTRFGQHVLGRLGGKGKP
jgi:hypothetical protein